MSETFNLSSILLGLAAWAIPVVCILRRNRPARKKNGIFLVISFGACAFSLCLQIAEIGHRVDIQDWSALMDTVDFQLRISVVLVVATIVLNLLALAATREE